MLDEGEASAEARLQSRWRRRGIRKALADGRSVIALLTDEDMARAREQAVRTGCPLEEAIAAQQRTANERLISWALADGSGD